MKISRNMKKLMSSIMVTALFFASLFIVQPVKAVAADSTPTVRFLDTELLLNGTSEVQGMRFAIEVSNADKAKDCGIKIKANGREKTISVLTGQNKLYSKAGNTVIYSAVVTGIPANYTAGNFEFSGFVTPIEGTTPVTTGPDTKTLEQVAQDTGYDINVDGDKIVATENEGDELTPDSWNAGQVSLEKNLGGKKVKISFQMRVEGADSVVMNFQTNYKADDYSIGEWNQTIKDTWTSFDFQWDMPECTNEYPVFFLSEPQDSTYDKDAMRFYIKDFSVTPVEGEPGNENSVEGTALKAFTYSNGTDVTYATVQDTGLGKEVTQLTTGNNGYQSTGIVVKFTLPSGKTLADYDTLSVKLNSDQQGWKQMGVDWRESEYTQTSFGNTEWGAYSICDKTGSHYPSNGGDWKTETFSLDYDVSGTDITGEQSGQDVYLGILYDADANTNIKFTDIILSKSN